MEAPSSNSLGTVAARMQERLSDLSASERKVARALLADYPVAGLDTVASLGAVAGVSAPTVTRFAVRLGYDGFPDLQDALRRELNNLMGSPLEQYPTASLGDLPPVDWATRLVNTAMSGVVADDMLRAATLIATCGSVLIAGGRFSRSLAEYLQFHLMLLRRAVFMTGEDSLELQNQVAAIGRHHVLVLFDFRRYDDYNVRLASEARKRGASVVLLTDLWLSPACESAEVVLPAPVATDGGFDSLIGSMALCDHLIRSVAAQLADAGRDHLLQLETVRDALGDERPAGFGNTFPQ